MNRGPPLITSDPSSSMSTWIFIAVGAGGFVVVLVAGLLYKNYRLHKTKQLRGSTSMLYIVSPLKSPRESPLQSQQQTMTDPPGVNSHPSKSTMNADYDIPAPYRSSMSRGVIPFSMVDDPISMT